MKNTQIWNVDVQRHIYGAHFVPIQGIMCAGDPFKLFFRLCLEEK